MLNFYRVMHYIAKRGLVIVCRLYVCTSLFSISAHIFTTPSRGQAEARLEAWPRGLNITEYNCCTIYYGFLQG